MRLNATSAPIDSYTKAWSTHFGIAIETYTAGIERGRLPTQIEIALYRIVQEALNNVAKHAAATSVALILERRQERAVLLVEDNGRGFEVSRAGAAPAEQRLGLTGMRERAVLVLGTLDIESEPGHGTTVIARIPLPVSAS